MEGRILQSSGLYPKFLIRELWRKKPFPFWLSPRWVLQAGLTQPPPYPSWISDVIISWIITKGSHPSLILLALLYSSYQLSMHLCLPPLMEPSLPTLEPRLCYQLPDGPCPLALALSQTWMSFLCSFPGPENPQPPPALWLVLSLSSQDKFLNHSLVLLRLREISKTISRLYGFLWKLGWKEWWSWTQSLETRVTVPPQLQDSDEAFWKLPWRPLLSSVHFWKQQYASEQQILLKLPPFLETLNYVWH